MGVCLSSGSPGTACSAGTSSALSIATFSAALTAQMLKVTTCSVSSVTSALAITSLLVDERSSFSVSFVLATFSFSYRARSRRLDPLNHERLGCLYGLGLAKIAHARCTCYILKRATKTS